MMTVTEAYAQIAPTVDRSNEGWRRQMLLDAENLMKAAPTMPAKMHAPAAEVSECSAENGVAHFR